MSVVRTDLRDTRPRAREISYSPIAPFTNARNVQSALDQIITGASNVMPPAIVPKSIGIAQSPYNVIGTDYVLYVDTSGGAVTINLQSAAVRGNSPLEIKDISGNASTNNISVVPFGTDTIDSLAIYPMASDFDAKTFKPKTGGYAVI